MPFLRRTSYDNDDKRKDAFVVRGQEEKPPEKLELLNSSIDIYLNELGERTVSNLCSVPITLAIELNILL